VAAQVGATRFEAGECTIVIASIDDERVLVVFRGKDRGELGSDPFRDLESRFVAGRPLELFFDLQSAVGATLEVSGKWAVWLRNNQGRLTRVSMLTGSPFVRLSAKVVKRFSRLGEKLQLYTDPSAFAGALYGNS
jgi:hypothetical protein